MIPFERVYQLSSYPNPVAFALKTALQQISDPQLLSSATAWDPATIDMIMQVYGLKLTPAAVKGLKLDDVFARVVAVEENGKKVEKIVFDSGNWTYCAESLRKIISAYVR
jgi:hypothetical protein